MSEQNKALVIKFIEAFSRGDAETTASCLAPDATAVAKGFGKLSGTRQRDMIVATTAAFTDAIPTGLRPTILNAIAEGDRVAVEFEGNAVLASGKDYCNQYCMVFTLENGLIKNVNEYYCTILADDRILPMLAGVEEQRNAAANQ
jgi:ketosteroid isomerase-like protein